MAEEKKELEGPSLEERLSLLQASIASQATIVAAIVDTLVHCGLQDVFVHYLQNYLQDSELAAKLFGTKEKEEEVEEEVEETPNDPILVPNSNFDN